VGYRRKHGRNIVILAMLAAGGIAFAANPHPTEPPVQFAQVIIHERVIVRIPSRVAPDPAPLRWRERPGPKCMPLQGIAGAVLIDPQTVDFILPGRACARSSNPPAPRSIIITVSI